MCDMCWMGAEHAMAEGVRRQQEAADREAMRMQDARPAHGHRDAPAEKWLVTWRSGVNTERCLLKSSEDVATATAEKVIHNGGGDVRVSRVVYETREVTKRELVKIEGEVKP